MPSSSSKQHRFMEAVAHNPAFAKKVGISQSVGKDFSAADKGKKFGRGGAINKQDTQHGSMDMPFKSLKKFGGMKSGGKVKRYEDGGDVDLEGVGKENTYNVEKPKIVTKEELAKSGLSLRDFMNKQQGKTRRGPTPMTAEGNTRTLKQENEDVARVERGMDKTPESPTATTTRPPNRSFQERMKMLTSRKMARGGMSGMPPEAMAAMRRRPRMGAGMPPPAKSLKKYAGMKSGGKVRRFEEGGESYNDSRPFAETNASEDLPVTKIVPGSAPSKSRGSADFNAAYKQAVIDSKTSGAKTFDYGGKPIAIKSPKPISSSTVTADENVATPAVTGRADKVSKNMPSAAKKEENTERLGAGMLAAASLLPAGRATKVASTLNAERMRRAEQLSSMAERKAMLANRRSAANAREAAYDARRASDMEAGFKKGGAMKYAKGGMHKMPNGKMMKNSAMKEGGMPMKDGKPAFMMGKKKMMGGGMAGYAKGGGIESSGKTKGTVIRMASGGSVSSASSRADGIAQRGKTRC